MNDGPVSLQEDFARLEEDFHAMVNFIPQLAWMARSDGWIFWYNQRWFDYTGRSLQEMQGWGWRSVHHEDHVARVTAHFSKMIQKGEPWEDTFPLRSKTGEWRWFLSRAMPIRDSEGNIRRWFGTNTDITEQKEAEERQTLLMREVDHRAKNALAVAQAVVNLTRAETITDYKRAVEGRIGSLARAHSLLAASRWEGADLHTLIRDELAPYACDGMSNVAISGEATTLAPAVAQSLALALHELATNAAKYGALSVPGGQVSISWTGHDGRITLDWLERGGPAVVAPQRTGFGSNLLDRMAKSFDSGGLVRTWDREGLHCRITIRASDTDHSSADDTSRLRETAPPARSEPTILVVEDEPLTALDLEMRLQDNGYRVLGPANTLEAARELLAETTPDLALLDANLGGERSWPLAEELQKSGVQVIFCTGYEQLEDLPEVLSICPVVTKPFRDDALLAALASARHRLAAEKQTRLHGQMAVDA